jgi:hypothetical protein
MSTRATYQFDGYESGHDVTVYIHHDGYPTGAAVYFYDTLMNCKGQGNMATRFIRTNSKAEITADHEYHGDTDYRYTVHGDGPDAEILVYQCCWDDDDKRVQPVQIFSGRLWDFMHENSKHIENYEPFRRIKAQYADKMLLMNLTMAQQSLNNEFGTLHHLRAWDHNPNLSNSSANWQGAAKRLKTIMRVFPELVTDEIDYFTSTITD